MRRKAAQSIGEVLERNVGLFALITNTLAKDKQIDDKWRRYPQPISARNLANQVEDDVVEALVTAVRNKYGRLSHRSEERRVGKECVRTFRSRVSPDHKKKKH